jgi:hypothetical protein
MTKTAYLARKVPASARCPVPFRHAFQRRPESQDNRAVGKVAPGGEIRNAIEN